MLWAVVATVALLARLTVLKGKVNRAPWSMLRRRSAGGGPVALAVALLLMVGSVLFRLNLSLSVGAQVLVFVGVLIVVDVVCRVVFLDRFRRVAMHPSPQWPDEVADSEQAK